MKSIAIYCGEESGRLLETLLRKAKSYVYVSSPYLTPEYVTLLLEKAREGVKVRLITSYSKVNKEALELLENAQLIERRRGRKATPLKALILVTLASVVYPPLLALLLLFVWPPTFIVIALKKIKKRKKIDILLSVSPVSMRVKVPAEKFVHAKIYVVDGVAVVGSANLTWKGLHENVECLVVMRGEAAEAVKKAFEEIWEKAY